MYNREKRFGLYAVLLGRSNPDGTKPSASNFLGFTGTVDLSDVLTAGVAKLSVKIDDGTIEEKDVTFDTEGAEPVSDITAITVAEAVAALTTSAFTGITWSAGTDVNGETRVKGVSATGTYVQVTGDLAAAMDFGEGVTYGGKGLEIFKYIGDQEIGSGLTSDTDKIDAQTKDSEGPTGGVTRMNIPAIRLGVTAVLTVKVDDWGTRECVERGTWDRTLDTYTPPTVADSNDVPIFWVEAFAPLSSKSNNNLGDEGAVEKKTLWNCQGSVDDPEYTFDWSARNINITASEYTNESGETVAADKYERMSKADYTALNLSDV